jgi:hypothetical protein
LLDHVVAGVDLLVQQQIDFSAQLGIVGTRGVEK